MATASRVPSGHLRWVEIKQRVKLAKAEERAQHLPPGTRTLLGKSKTNYCLSALCCVCVCARAHGAWCANLLWHRLRTIVSGWLSLTVTSQTVQDAHPSPSHFFYCVRAQISLVRIVKTLRRTKNVFDFPWKVRPTSVINSSGSAGVTLAVS